MSSQQRLKLNGTTTARPSMQERTLIVLLSTAAPHRTIGGGSQSQSSKELALWLHRVVTLCSVDTSLLTWRAGLAVLPPVCVCGARAMIEEMKIECPHPHTLHEWTRHSFAGGGADKREAAAGATAAVSGAAGRGEEYPGPPIAPPSLGKTGESNAFLRGVSLSRSSGDAV